MDGEQAGYGRAVIAFVCAMPIELRPLRRRLRLRRSDLGYVGRIGDQEVIAVVTGMGTALARAGTVRLLDAVEVEWVIVVGITGAIESETPIGTLVLPKSSSMAPTAPSTVPHHSRSAMSMGRCGPPTNCSSTRRYTPAFGHEA